MTDLLRSKFKAVNPHRPTRRCVFRHRREPARRLRRRDQHHAAHPAGYGVQRWCTWGTTGRWTKLSRPRCRKMRRGIAVSSYQGGHNEYFPATWSTCCARGGEHIQVFGGGGGVIKAALAEIRALADKGVRIFIPEDGQRMGLRRHGDRRDGDESVRDRDLLLARAGRSRGSRRPHRGRGASWRSDHRAGEPRVVRPSRCRRRARGLRRTSRRRSSASPARAARASRR